MIIDWTVQTIVRFPWRRIDFEFENRSFRYIQQSRELASILRTHSDGSFDDEDKAFQSISRVLSGLCWSLKVPVFSDLHGGCGAANPKSYMKRRKPTVASKAKLLQNYHVFSFSLPIVKNNKAWKALSYYREAFSANSEFHQAISFYKTIEVAFSKKKERKRWIYNNYDKFVSRNDNIYLSSLKDPKKFFAEDVGHHAVAHQMWNPDKLPDYKLGHIATRILKGLATEAIRNELGVNKDHEIRCSSIKLPKSFRKRK